METQNSFRTPVQEINKWFNDKGDNTHILNYNINDNSIIMDLGGYTGAWIESVVSKFNPNIYVIEPITEFYNVMVNKFKDNNKVHLLNVGVANENKNGVIFLDGDGTTAYGGTVSGSKGKNVNVTFKTMDNILNEWNLTNIDLLQINIEGDEFPLLEYMLEQNLVQYFKNIQIQFHHIGFDFDVVTRREKIQQGLRNNGFTKTYDYPWVWESWRRSFKQ